VADRRDRETISVLCALCVVCISVTVARWAKHLNGPSIPPCKKILIYRNSEMAHVSPSRLDLEGRSYIVTDREPGCGGRDSVGTRWCGQGGSSRQHFDGYVHDAIEPCGGRRMRVRQNRAGFAVTFFALEFVDFFYTFPKLGLPGLGQSRHFLAAASASAMAGTVPVASA
jgi:hypothetical protein